MGEAVVGDIAAVGGDGGIGLADAQISIGNGDVVVAGILTGHHEVGRVGIGVSATGQAGNADVVAVEESTGGSSVLGLGGAVVGEIGGGAGDAGVFGGDRYAARNVADVVALLAGVEVGGGDAIGADVLPRGGCRPQQKRAVIGGGIGQCGAGIGAAIVDLAAACRNGERGKEAAQQRRGVAVVNPPGSAGTTDTVDGSPPGTEGSKRLHLGGGMAWVRRVNCRIVQRVRRC